MKLRNVSSGTFLVLETEAKADKKHNPDFQARAAQSAAAKAKMAARKKIAGEAKK
jgi:hypothetical protein